MAIKAIRELRALTEPELDEKMTGLKQKLVELRLQKAGGRLEKPSLIRSARRDIARILTLKKENKENARAKKSQ